MNEIFKALAHPVRREIVSLLRDGPMASGDIAALFDMSWPTITGHLNVLKEAGLVEAERLGVSMRYRLNLSAAEEAVGFLVDLLGPRPAGAGAGAGARAKGKRKGNAPP